MTSKTRPLAPIVEALHSYLKAHGHVNYEQVAKQLGLTRQYIHYRLKAAHEKGEITEQTYNKLRQTKISEGANEHMKVTIRAENKKFVSDYAKTLGIHPSKVVDTAIACYRERIAQLPHVWPAMPDNNHRNSPPSTNFWGVLSLYTKELSTVVGPLLSTISDTANAVDRCVTRSLPSAAVNESEIIQKPKRKTSTRRQTQ